MTLDTKLGIEPKIDFKTGLNNTSEWYLENETWWRPLLNK